MISKKAILYLEELHCITHTGEWNGDDIYFNVYADGKLIDHRGGWCMKSGETDRVDLEIECSYYNEIMIDLWESDGDPNSKDDHIGEAYIKRTDPLDKNKKGKRRVTQTNGDGDYEFTFRVISDPIPTVRILGIYCEHDSNGMDGGVVNAIANKAIEVTEKAGEILGKSPRPKRQLQSEAFMAAAQTMRDIQEVVGWLKEVIEGADDVYMKHLAGTSSRGFDGAFFPPEGDVYKMWTGDEVHFESKYGQYFRFPLDEGKVTIEFRERDKVGKDIIIGSFIIDPDQIKENTSNGIESGVPEKDGVESIPGGIAVYDGPAVVEIANCYYDENSGGAGAIYYICYSVGTENWLLPATTEGQGDPADGVLPESISGFFVAPLQGRDYATAQSECQERGGVLPTVEDMTTLIINGWIPDTWPKGNYWLQGNYYMDIETRQFYSIVGDPAPPLCSYTCKFPDQKSGIEGWNGGYGVTLTSPDGMVDHAAANSGAIAQGGELLTEAALQELAQSENYPSSWPVGPYWTQEATIVDLPQGGAAQAADPSSPAYYTSVITTFEKDTITPWEGIGGYYSFPYKQATYQGAVEESQRIGCVLPTMEHLRVLIQQNLVPETWPTGLYWTADQKWLDITDINNSGGSADGSESYYYASVIPGLPGEVESVIPLETEDRFFASPMGPVSLEKAKQICEDRGGELPNLETLRLMVENNQIPAEWPTDQYYYTDNGHMVVLSTMEGDELVLKSAEGEQKCYFTCEFKKTNYDPVPTGQVGAPQYLSQFDVSIADCIAKGGQLISLEHLLYLIKEGKVPNSWLAGKYWATASDATPIYVDIETGEYWYSAHQSEQCFYACHTPGGELSIDPWIPGDGLLLFPEGPATFANAQAACNGENESLPTLDELEVLFSQFQEGSIPNKWPRGQNIYYWTAEGKCIDSTNFNHVISPDTSGSAAYHFTIKKLGTANGVITGYEVKDGDYYYTAPARKLTYQEALEACRYHGGELATAGEVWPNMMPSQNKPGWTQEEDYLSKDCYVLVGMTYGGGPDPHWIHEPDLPNSNTPYLYSCKIKDEGYIPEVKGYFTAPRNPQEILYQEDLVPDSRLPTLQEMLYLIENDLIPKNWPTNYLYWAAGSLQYAKNDPYHNTYQVDISTGNYKFIGDAGWVGYAHYSCLKPSEELEVERYKGVDAFYVLPSEQKLNYQDAFYACNLHGGELPTVEELNRLAINGHIPGGWPKGYFWARGGYPVNVQDGTFSHSLTKEEECYVTCRLEQMGHLVATGEEVNCDGHTFFPPFGAIMRPKHVDHIGRQGGYLPSFDQMLSLINQDKVPASWPESYYYVNDHYYSGIEIPSGNLIPITEPDRYSTTVVDNPKGLGLKMEKQDFIPQPGQWYRLKARHTGQYLVVKGGASTTENGQPVEQQPLPSDNGLFKFEADGSGHYRIYAKNSGKLLFVNSASLANDALIQQWEQRNDQGDYVLFRPEYVEGGFYRLVAKHSDKCISIFEGETEAGAAAVQYECLNEGHQQFAFEKVHVLNPGGKYRLLARHSGLGIGIKGGDNGKNDNDPAQQEFPNQKNSEIWHLNPLSSDPTRYLICSAHTGKALGPKDASTSDGAGIVQHTYTQGNTHMEYYLQDVGGGFYELANAANGMVIGVQGGETNLKNGAPMVQSVSTHGPHQQFELQLPSSSLYSGRTYRIISRKTLKPIEVAEGDFDTINGTPIQLGDPKAIDNQVFLFEAVNGWWKISSRKSGKTVMVSDDVPDNKADGVPLVQGTYSASSNQFFKIHHCGGGWYEIYAQHSGKGLAIAGSHSTSGDPVQQWPRNQNAVHYQFKFEEV